MGSEGPPLSFRKLNSGVGVTGRLSRSSWTELPSSKLLDGSSTKRRQSGELVDGGGRLELVCGRETKAGGSSFRVEYSSSEALLDMSLRVGVVVALNCRGSAR